MGQRPKDITGGKFTRLRAVERLDERDANRKVRWRCKCDCGNETIVTTLQLTSGNTKSCGCLRAEGQNRTEHGMYRTPEYMAWAKMKERCSNPANADYAQHGGRGICVARKWLESFEAFLADVGARPGSDYELHRDDPDEGFTPSNVRWGLRSERPKRRAKRR
jgi:hypothetical protein